MPAHEQDDIPGEFKPAVRTRASSVKVISGIFGAMAGLPLTLHSDVTGSQYKMRFVGEVQMNHHDALISLHHNESCSAGHEASSR
jgi:hypothetical protein